ncbi:MAG TPA: hypothetical protein DDW20_00135 [Firmicutes bacterium]|nr:hypothetical protein [Bacillota bacterium]
MENEENRIVDVESKTINDDSNNNQENIKSEKANVERVDDHDYNKDALTCFILTVIATGVGSFYIVGSIGGLILNIIALSCFAKKGLKADKNPFKVFGKIGYILSIVSICFTALMLLFWITYTILIGLGLVVSGMH